MLKHYINNTRQALLRLRTDKDGVVSLEYVIVAACVVGVVITAFGAGGSLPTALGTGFTAITTAMTAL
jgi:Flp pilus assembly pilin Flp